MTLQIVEVGGYRVTSTENDILKTFVGSCVAICLYDEQQPVSGMAHVMLPTKPPSTSSVPENMLGRYADIAIETMLNEMKELGTKLCDVKAKLAGGAKVFQNENDDNMFDVGKSNLSKIKQLLQNNNIPLIAEDAGATKGRWVKFVSESKLMFVGKANIDEKQY